MNAHELDLEEILQSRGYRQGNMFGSAHAQVYECPIALGERVDLAVQWVLESTDQAFAYNLGVLHGLEAALDRHGDASSSIAENGA